MQARTSRTVTSTASDELLLPASSGSFRVLTALRESAHPFQISLILLALAVALFGYGYRLSLYQYRSFAVKNFPVAKAVVEEHRCVSPQSAASGLRERDRLQWETDWQEFRDQDFKSMPVQSDCALHVFALPRPLPFFSSSLPLRSPPSFAN